MSNKNEKTKNKEVVSKSTTKKKTTTVSKPKTTTKQSQPKPKNLTMAKVKRAAKEAYRMEEYELNDSDKIKFFPIFPQGRINDLLKELQQDQLYADENDIEFNADDEFMVSYVLFLCIKYFTSLEKGFSKKLEDKLLQFEYLVDTGYYNQIVNEVFMPSEIRKVFDVVAGQISTYQFIEHVNVLSNEQLEDLKIKNKDLLDSIENMGSQIK